MGYWFNVSNRIAFEPQFAGAFQFAGVILQDFDGNTWAWYANDLDDENIMEGLNQRWISFPQGLHAHYFWPDGMPGNIPRPG